MYTQCPECQTAFRVTVEVLQKAGGRVRCGGCEHAFSALDYLSDGVPGTASNPSSSDRDSVDTATPARDFDAKSKALLETLDELAGPQDIRIEDTGIEWRVLGENEVIDSDAESPVNSAADAAASEDRQADLATERRYDDNTKLPDDFADESESPYVAESPKRRATDVDEQQTDFDTHQVDLVLDGDESWAQLFDGEDEENAVDELQADTADSDDDLARQLEEAEARQIADDSALLPQLAESLLQEVQAIDGKIPFDVEVELAAIHSDVTAIINDADANSLSDDLDSQFNLQAEALGLEITRDEALDGADSEDEGIEDPADADAEDLSTEDIAVEDVADNQLENALVADDTAQDDDLDGDDDDDDELSAEEEAAIIQKLRDSTGSFQKQIHAAQQALDDGDIDEYNEEDELDDTVDDESKDDVLRLAGDDDPDPITENATADTDPDENNTLAQLAATDSTTDTDDTPDSDDDDDESAAHDALSRTMIQAGIDPSVLDAANAETIIMEGDFIHVPSSGQASDTAENQSISGIRGIGDEQSLVDTYMLNKGKASASNKTSGNWGMIGGIGVLLVLLVAQYLHASRQTFATYGAFNQTMGPVYRALGNAVTPRWNIKGWQFERTNGSTDDNDQVLTVFSTVRNTSEDPLPYPLVHLSLTDRWEDIIGSKILEPSEYLAGAMDPRTPVAPGESFTAVIAIERPSVEATGFQLYVCYRVSPGRVRCATEDFKE